MTTLYHKGTVDGAVVATGTDFFDADLVPQDGRPVAVRIDCTFETAAKLIVRRTTENGTQESVLNDDVDLKATAGNTFTIAMGPDVTGYNFRHDDAGNVTVRYMTVDEVGGGVI